MKMTKKQVVFVLDQLCPLPKRRHERFEDYLADRSLFYSDNGKPIKYPCAQCRGRGYFIDPKDHCSVEGYRYAQRHTCDKCNGTKTGTRTDLVRSYKKEVEKWRSRRQEILTGRMVLKAILSRLSASDLATLLRRHYMYTDKTWKILDMLGVPSKCDQHG